MGAGIAERQQSAISRHMRCSKRVPLFDELVGAAEQRDWKGEAKRFCGFEFDNQLNFRGLLHWVVDWLLALENACGLKDGMEIGFSDISSISTTVVRDDECTSLV